MLWFYLHLFVRLTYHATITLLIIDQFLVFHLQMRYLILWPYERLLKLLKVIYLASFLTYIFCVLVCSQANWLGLHFQYFVHWIFHSISYFRTYNMHIQLSYQRNEKRIYILKTVQWATIKQVTSEDFTVFLGWFKLLQ